MPLRLSPGCVGVKVDAPNQLKGRDHRGRRGDRGTVRARSLARAIGERFHVRCRHEQIDNEHSITCENSGHFGNECVLARLGREIAEGVESDQRRSVRADDRQGAHVCTYHHQVFPTGLGGADLEHRERRVDSMDAHAALDQRDGQTACTNAQLQDRTGACQALECGDHGLDLAGVAVPGVVDICERIAVGRWVLGSHRGRLYRAVGAAPAVSLNHVNPPVIYLDNAASAPTRPEAIDAMMPVLTECYANPSGAHRMARDARRLLDDARDTLAVGLGCLPGEIIYTAGGTEADNLAVLGVHGARGGTVVCSATEHHAVLMPVEHLGGRVIGVDHRGRLDLTDLAANLDPSVTVVSVGLVNGETGVIQDLEAVAEVIREHAPEAVLHTDAVQAFPWIDVARGAAAADLISIAAHKFGGPKGVGALAVREGVDIAPQLLGGGHERGKRSGTHNSPGIVGMAAAAEAAISTREETVARVSKLRDRLADGLASHISGTHETGVTSIDGRVDRSDKVAGSCHLCFDDIESEALLFLLEQDGILASAASSCSSGAQDPSHVLAAMGYSRELAGGSLRLSLGYESSEDQVDAALALIPPAVARLREIGS